MVPGWTLSGGCDPQVYLFDHLTILASCTNEKNIPFLPPTGYLLAADRGPQNPEGNRSRFTNWSPLGGSPGQKAVCSLENVFVCVRSDCAAPVWKGNKS